MTVSLLERGVVAPVQVADLQVRREDIEFRNIEQSRLRISVTVTNHGSAPSRPTFMSLQAAPLGAFLPWRDLISVRVPSIGPYQRVEVTAELAVPRPRVLGDFSRVPPRRLLAAIGGEEESAPHGTRANPIAFILRNLSRGNVQGEQDSALPDDPLSLLSRPGAHWAGNVNVLIGDHAVERHLARALRVYAGRQNLAIFFVGDRPDEYQFTLAGSGVAWDAALFDFTDMCSFLTRPSSVNAIPQSKWVKMAGWRVVLLAVQPPEYCGTGEIEVHVRQRSTQREAVVEFSLDPSAAGPGCYAV